MGCAKHRYFWFTKAERDLRAEGWEELRTARSTYVLRDPRTNELCGMFCLYVDDACFGGKGQYYEDVLEKTMARSNIGRQSKFEFDFLGRHVKQDPKDFHIEIDMEDYCSKLEKVFVPMARRRTPKAPLTPTELSHYRSLVGQLAWPARQCMPQLAYHVSDLQQKTGKATVHDLFHANRVTEWARIGRYTTAQVPPL